MKQIKARRILGLITPDWVRQVREQMEFNRLGREALDLMWKVCARCPERRTESMGIKIGHRFFLIGGFQSLDRVLDCVDVFDFQTGKWVDRMAMPPDMPQSHAGVVAGEGRFIYAIGGQLGPRCSPAVANCFTLDIQTRSWGRLPSLPEPRYGSVAQLWRGRLHAISGTKPDRWTSAREHWSIAVESGEALEDQWREERPIPRGGLHRGSAICGDRLYVFGGQEGDVKSVAGDSCHECDWNTPPETVYGDSFVWDGEPSDWETVATMPAARTHTESVVTVDHYAVIVGGNEGRSILSDLVQVYDSRTDRWGDGGHLPYCMKTTAAYHEGWLYLFAGQRSHSRTDLSPGEVLNSVWRAKFEPGVAWKVSQGAK